ncbi:tumor necrosis factor receptor superfamily member 1A [Conger conger]|uniref:tumor necrosis factor receptor superfamily member 1A n=1 Tax=Conger conger TaxID=82655 RepID=UPI002A5A345F|nr:tumor necrosis factor receptor superfamily member 1A [Conger conger]XP_061109352.1 tumor necrosis factor receptor superfamily member 1A [Conger conger]
MDGAQHRRKWKKILTVIPFLLICLDVNTAASAVGRQADGLSTPSACKEDEFLHSSKEYCCNMCPPGFSMTKECAGPDLRSKCTICPPGLYRDEINYTGICKRCSPCKTDHNKNVTSLCTNKKDLVCECKAGYEKYVLDKYTWECKPVENPSPTPKAEATDGQLKPGEPWSLYAFVALLAVAVVVAVVYIVHGRFRSRGPTGENVGFTAVVSTMDSCVQESHHVSSGLSSNQIPSQIPSLQDQLPDCIPKEFKFSQFVYFVLDLVPADRFKELVRQLGVSERDIERAERDHRFFKEAQHQMLKVWGESRGMGLRGTQPLRLVQELVHTLRMMGLVGCAEAIEERYDIQ